MYIKFLFKFSFILFCKIDFYITIPFTCRAPVSLLQIYRSYPQSLIIVILFEEYKL